MFHIYRNSPLGRENLLQAIYFCKQLKNLELIIYRPITLQAVMYHNNQTLATITLDPSYTRDPDSAREAMARIISQTGHDLKTHDFIPEEFTGSDLPNLPNDFTIMSCPRVISDSSKRIGLGHLGPKVRSLVKQAPFPLFVPCLAYKPWKSIAAFFGGSDVGLKSVKVALNIANSAQVKLNIYTQINDANRNECEQNLKQSGLMKLIENKNNNINWIRFENKTLRENLMQVPYDCLAVVGAAGKNIIRELVMGSKLELIQTLLPNPLVIVGPHCTRFITNP